MTKQMRVRIARIAAGAVIAAGASLTAAGAAQAVDMFGEPDPTPTCIPGTAGCPDPEPTDPEPTATEPTEPEPTETEPTEPEPTETEPTEPEPTETEPTEPEPTATEPTEPEPTATEPTEPEPTATEPTNPGGTTEPGPGPSTDPGPGATDQPTTPGDGGDTDNGDAGTCTVDLDGAECVDSGNSNTDTNNAGSQPVQQGQAKEELAETGAAETSFLIIGAATMIAGGIGFRMLPRLVGGGRAAV
ncbi:LPXTG cell wall anchor domain-containing protein [Streptomyces sp. MBT42]|uniref:LPXTG cell wall anchor domain-containing protein n=1 Tax=Streptomyces sp. MBT42 TaxID=1488373 RepID=UPI001E28E20D|nr:LPXTG cell wall anchor domain-containing protein [Streptomyces sp. MBT42]MCD2466558.1 LPXTG cell wall anchor domain-containing protein [Streptomyces sp. MBT42]